MAVKVVQGLVGKSELESKSVQTSQAQNPAAQGVSSPQSIQKAVATATRSSEAVVATLRSYRSQGSSTQPIKDPKEAQRVASDVAEQIRGDKGSDASGAHGGLSSGKSGPVLIN